MTRTTRTWRNAGQIKIGRVGTHARATVAGIFGATSASGSAVFVNSSGHGDQTLQYGPIAEEVAEVAPQLVVTDAEGKPYSVRYHELPSLLLNELQRRQQVIAELSSRLALVEGNLASAAASEGATR